MCDRNGSIRYASMMMTKFYGVGRTTASWHGINDFEVAAACGNLCSYIYNLVAILPMTLMACGLKTTIRHPAELTGNELDWPMVTIQS